MNSEKQIHAALLDVLTALPGKIVTYSAGRATVQPTLGKRLANGEALPAPQIFNVPMVFPTGMSGKAKISVPLAAGDPVMLIFSSRGLDEWKVTGEATPETLRTFDLTDAFAVPFGGHVGEYDTENLSMAFGDASFNITPDGEMIITCQKMTVNAATTAWNGVMDMVGGLSVTAGNGGDGAAKFGGNVETRADVKAGGGNVSLLNHTHTAPNGETTTGHG
ncbi:Gp138 family membrane-puncturing spike protein [Sodalis sp.]|uniref:Gp138 family membrane-puncturing spike protein n=1 Tax=Sodalis sp. (in: enterobacteria) TaxID=1898979 RepID=UPI003872E2D0